MIINTHGWGRRGDNIPEAAYTGISPQHALYRL